MVPTPCKNFIWKSFLTLNCYLFACRTTIFTIFFGSSVFSSVPWATTLIFPFHCLPMTVKKTIWIYTLRSIIPYCLGVRKRKEKASRLVSSLKNLLPSKNGLQWRIVKMGREAVRGGWKTSLHLSWAVLSIKKIRYGLWKEKKSCWHAVIEEHSPPQLAIWNFHL